MSEHLIRKYYANNVKKEWRRLVRDPYHQLEFITTMHYLKRYLPSSGLILDAGGGPGRYTIELARQGYDVVLLDFVAENLEFAKRQIKRAKVQKHVKALVEGSIDNLEQFDNNTFDAVLCLGGPLSHVVDRDRREKAVSEIIRVAKENAPIFVSVIGRLSVLIEALIRFPDEIELPHFKEVRDTGDYLGGYGFAPAHFFLPEELYDLFNKHNVKILEMVGLEGLSSHHRRKTNILAKNKIRWGIWLETHFKTCTHLAVVGLSEHILIICRKIK